MGNRLSWFQIWRLFLSYCSRYSITTVIRQLILDGEYFTAKHVTWVIDQADLKSDIANQKTFMDYCRYTVGTNTVRRKQKSYSNSAWWIYPNGYFIFAISPKLKIFIFLTLIFSNFWLKFYFIFVGDSFLKTWNNCILFFPEIAF